MTTKYLSLSIRDGALHGWIAGDESDAFTINGPPHTLEVVARVLRASLCVEHEFSQRGAVREPFVNDVTAAEKEQQS